MSQRHPSASCSCPSFWYVSAISLPFCLDIWLTLLPDIKLWCLELGLAWEFPFWPKMQERKIWNPSWMLVIYVGDYISHNSNHIICFVFLSSPFGARLKAVMSRVLPGSAIPLLTNRPLISTSTMYVLPTHRSYFPKIVDKYVFGKWLIPVFPFIV